MLSAIGRAAARRVASSSCNVAGTSSRLVFVSRFALSAPASRASSVSSVERATRGYATATATKSTTRKKTPVKKTTTATKKSASSKAKTRKPVKKVVKAKAAKPKAKPKPKKPSPETLARLEKRDLKKAALYEEPKALPESAYAVFIQDTLRGIDHGGKSMTDQFKSTATKYASLSSSEKQQYQTKAEENRRTNAVNYKAWVESHSPQAIWQARRARKTLKRKYNVPKTAVRLIHDDRLPKMPATGYSLFTRARWASGEYTGLATESAKAIAREWKDLSDKERQPYADLAAAASERYAKDVEALFGRPPAKRSSLSISSSS